LLPTKHEVREVSRSLSTNQVKGKKKPERSAGRTFFSLLCVKMKKGQKKTGAAFHDSHVWQGRCGKTGVDEERKEGYTLEEGEPVSPSLYIHVWPGGKGKKKCI